MKEPKVIIERRNGLFIDRLLTGEPVPENVNTDLDGRFLAKLFRCLYHIRDRLTYVFCMTLGSDIKVDGHKWTIWPSDNDEESRLVLKMDDEVVFEYCRHLMDGGKDRRRDFTVKSLPILRDLMMGYVQALYAVSKQRMYQYLQHVAIWADTYAGGDKICLPDLKRVK